MCVELGEPVLEFHCNWQVLESTVLVEGGQVEEGEEGAEEGGDAGDDAACPEGQATAQVLQHPGWYSLQRSQMRLVSSFGQTVYWLDTLLSAYFRKNLAEFGRRILFPRTKTDHIWPTIGQAGSTDSLSCEAVKRGPGAGKKAAFTRIALLHPQKPVYFSSTKHHFCCTAAGKLGKIFFPTHTHTHMSLRRKTHSKISNNLFQIDGT